MIEIERKYLLDRMPTIPEGAEVWQIEQGYVRDPDQPVPGSSRHALSATGRGEMMSCGRLRRTKLQDGSLVFTHTIKSGTGVSRNEIEQRISEEQFNQHWPRTAGRRLTKTRYRVPEHGVTWEIDCFNETKLVLAEVELAKPDAPVLFPPWLKPHVIREVTDDPAFTNAAIASRLGYSS